MTKEQMKQKLRASKGYHPKDEALLDIAVDESVQFVWDAHDWSWKTIVDTFTSSGATYNLPDNVDNLLELTYGSNNRNVIPLPSHRIGEIYSNIARTGSITYYYSLYSADSDNLTIELTPAPASGTTFTYRAYRKIDYGDLGAIPEKLHSLVFTGARMFLAKDFIETWPSLERAIQSDKPLRHKKWSTGVDPIHAGRVANYNSVLQGGMSQDTSRPID